LNLISSDDVATSRVDVTTRDRNAPATRIHVKILAKANGLSFGSNGNPLDLIERNLISSPIIEWSAGFRARRMHTQAVDLGTAIWGYLDRSFWVVLTAALRPLHSPVLFRSFYS
jgi:hypothetical protein